jgi:hypothetical protein
MKKVAITTKEPDKIYVISGEEKRVAIKYQKDSATR